MGSSSSKSAQPQTSEVVLLTDLQQSARDYLARVNKRSPLVHCFSNYVAMDLMANAVLAAGASPAMVHSPDECADFTRISAALLINMGTYSPMWAGSMRKSIAVANETGKPWVLDPVGCGATPARTAVISELAGMQPTVIRGNASEIRSLTKAVLGHLPEQADDSATLVEVASRGVDSSHASHEALPAARALAAALGTVVAVTGEVDFVTDGEYTLYVANGLELCTKVTAAGCALTAVLAAFLTVRPAPAAATDDATQDAAAAARRDTVIAAASALAVFGLAAQLAAHRVAEQQTAPGGRRADAWDNALVGPGSLRVGLLDALHSLSTHGALGSRVTDHVTLSKRRVDSLLWVTQDYGQAKAWAAQPQWWGHRAE